MSVAVTEPVEDIEDQETVLHGLAEVTEGVRHAFHLAAEVTNGEVALDEGTEARIETQIWGFGIVQKLALECKLGPASGVANEVVEVEGDRPEDPGEDDAVETQPRGCLDRD